MFPLNSSTQLFNINGLTVVNYGLKIPPASTGSYSSLISASKNLKQKFVFFSFYYLVINDVNQQTSVCRVDISPNRGINVPCSNDVSSVFTYNSNGFPSTAITNLGMICNVACKKMIRIFFCLFINNCLI